MPATHSYMGGMRPIESQICVTTSMSATKTRTFCLIYIVWLHQSSSEKGVPWETPPWETILFTSTQTDVIITQRNWARTICRYDGREQNHSLQTSLTQNTLERSVSLFLSRVALLSIAHMCRWLVCENIWGDRICPCQESVLNQNFKMTL